VVLFKFYQVAKKSIISLSLAVVAVVILGAAAVVQVDI
jgi:uncharacterized membrane protein affecting hemolysin expression